MPEVQGVNMQKHILAMAAGLFVAQGYDGISMREIAEACQLSKAGLYYYFKDKEALFLALLDDYLSELETLLVGLASHPGSAREAISAFVQAVITPLPDNRHAIFKLASQDLGKINPAERAAFNQRYQEKFLNPLAGLLDAGIASGQIRPIDSRLAVWALLGLMVPFFNAHFVGQAQEVSKLVELIEMIFFEGVEVRS